MPLRDQVEELRTEVIKLMERMNTLENEKIRELEAENQKLSDKIRSVESQKLKEFVTIKELSDIMKCSERTIQKKIADKEIYATRKLGGYRIPVNQFYEKEPTDILKRKPGKLRKVSGGESMEELIFGNS